MLIKSDYDASFRKKRICNKMAEKEIDLLIIYSNTLKPDNVSYATGYNLIAGESWAAITVDGDINLWVSEAWDMDRAAADSWANEISQVEAFGDVIKRKTQGNKKVALAGLELVPSRYQTELGWLLLKSESGNGILEESALVKSNEELLMVRKNAEIADAGFQRALYVAKPGIKEYELLAEIEYAMREKGAVDNFQLMASGTFNKGMVVGREKKLTDGELLLFEITPTADSVTYSAQLCRTILLGRLSSEMQSKYEILVAAMIAALDLMKPGITVSDVCKVQNKIISEAGYGEYCGPPYMRTRGHGFGLTQPFNIDENNTTILEPGMTLVVHPNQFLPDTGYLALGEMVVVTQNGCEKLSQIPMQIFAIN